jgi:hypothetical protein
MLLKNISLQLKCIHICDVICVKMPGASFLEIDKLILKLL